MILFIFTVIKLDGELCTESSTDDEPVYQVKPMLGGGSPGIIKDPRGHQRPGVGMIGLGGIDILRFCQVV